VVFAYPCQSRKGKSCNPHHDIHIFHEQIQFENEVTTAATPEVGVVGLLVVATKTTSGITVATIRQREMCFRVGFSGVNVKDPGVGFAFSTVLLLGVGFGAALALSVPTIPIPVMSPTESITESSFLFTATFIPMT